MPELDSRHGVLIVEDDAIVALDIRQKLESFGYRVTGVVGRAGEVLAAVQKQRPHAVLMDIGLRGTSDGVTLAEEIFVCEDTPVVFLSGYSDKDIVRRAAQCGAYGYLTKPVSYAALTTTLDMAIEKHRDLRARRGVAQWLHRAFDAFDSAIVALDDGGAVQLMNREAIELTGWMLVEAKRTVPPWAEQLHALPRSDAFSLPALTTLETRDASARVMVQKFRFKSGGSVCVIHRCTPSNEPQTGPMRGMFS